MLDAAGVAELSADILRFQLQCLRVAGPALAGLGVALVLITASVVVNMVLTVLPERRCKPTIRRD